MTLNFELDLKNAKIKPVIHSNKISFNVDDGDTEGEISITIDQYKKIDKDIKIQLGE